MKNARILGFVAVVLLGFAAFLYYYMSHSVENSKIRISTNPWVGFTPFIYAQEKGWLEKTSFRFVWLVDLTENARLYERGFTQGFTATQYEALHFKNQHSIKPVFLIDRSYGADAIVSNRSLEEIQNIKEEVTVYLEQGSLNDDFFNAFVSENNLENIQFHKIDASQKSMATLGKTTVPVIIISYQPYLSGLLKKGFLPLASTRGMKKFFVIDALFVNEAIIDNREKELIYLKELFALSVSQLHKDPHEYYETIKGYLEGQTYEEFMATTTQIEWLHQKVPEPIISHLHSQKIETDRLLP